MPNVYGPTTTHETVTSERIQYGNSGCVATGSQSVVETSTTTVSYVTDNARGVDTPGWQKMRNSGHLLPMTAWERYHYDFLAQPAHRAWCTGPTAKRTDWTNFYRGYDVAKTTKSFFMAMVGEPDLQYYVQKAAAGIASSGWDALTFLAEIRQLRRMFSGIVDKMDSLSRGLSPGRAHDLWLEGRYGWRTLMYDIRDLHEVLTKANEKRTRYRESKGFQASDSSGTDTTSTSNGITERVVRNYSWTINLRGTVIADIDVPDIQFNPVTTAWEVTKLSFVVDWLWNVGQGLDAASFLLMAKAYRACGGYKVDIDHDGDVSLVGVTGSTICHANDASWSGSASIIERIPSSVSAIPRIKLRLDTWKAIDLLSLVLQRL